MSDDLRPEYDLSQLLLHGVQGKHAERFRAEPIAMRDSGTAAEVRFIDAVETYYESNGILSTSFTCKSKNACKRNGTDSGPKSAFVGSRYGTDGLPRLLFISLDAGWAELDDTKRTPAAVREELEREGVEEAKKRQNGHWYRTHELASTILREFDGSLNLDGITQYFAHTNASKCCAGGEGGAASPVAYLNCHQYLAGEVAALDPDIVVTQGKEANHGVDALVDKKITNRVDDFAAEVSLCGRRRFWLRTDHPRYARGFYRQRNCSDGWKSYATAIHCFYVTLS